MGEVLDIHAQRDETHPHPNPPLEGEGIQYLPPLKGEGNKHTLRYANSCSAFHINLNRTRNALTLPLIFHAQHNRCLRTLHALMSPKCIE
jgi:hypothetical protein